MGEIVEREELKSVFKSSTLFEGELLPLVLEPLNPEKNTLEDLLQLLAQSSQEFEELVLVHGGILIRGFQINTAADFEKVALVLFPNMGGEYLGTSPRLLQSGCKHVFSASEFPWYIPIPQHCEISFTKHPPKKIGFCCLQPPLIGGQTPICDFRKVFQQLPEELREKWQEKSLNMLRSYSSAKGGFLSRIDPYNVKGWDEVFQTNDRHVVEEVCDREEYKYNWKNEHFLRLSNLRPAYITHEITKQNVWFNHAHIFDINMIPAEFQQIRRQIRSGWKSPCSSFYFFFLEMFSRFVITVKSLFQKVIDYPTHVLFGDGSPIPSSEMQLVRKVIWENKRYFNWEKGDMMFLDNQLVSHGRMPFSGPRKVVVAWC